MPLVAPVVTSTWLAGYGDGASAHEWHCAVRTLSVVLGLFEDMLVVSHDACRTGRCWSSRILICVHPFRGGRDTARRSIQRHGRLYSRGKAWFILSLLLLPPGLPALRAELPGSRYDI